jgi:hypothetical protein
MGPVVPIIWAISATSGILTLVIVSLIRMFWRMGKSPEEI